MHKVYHGATNIVASPLCHIGRDNLDFGKGFYVTDFREQAVSWATRVVNLGLPQWLNIYELNVDYVSEYARCKTFTAYNEEWLDFIVKSRQGKKLNGDISMEYALKRLSEHQPNNQICIISQEILDKSLHFIKAEPLNDLAKKERTLC